ncbi:MAG: hypothetical protein LBS62_09410 [Clostridiales bacterium]|jgi:transcriptional antiterminator NusG|nr:hypothetical protein [Clostridiales bacterium]
MTNGEHLKPKWFSESANWFVLFVRSRGEQQIAEQIQSFLDPERYVVFCPTKDYAFKKNGVTTKRKGLWLDGYVFIVSMEDEDEVRKMVSPIINRCDDIYKFLTYDNEQIKLIERDKAIMTALLDAEFNIAALKAVAVGDKVQITDDALKGFGGKVVKVNKHKQCATIQVNMFERTIECVVMLDFVEKVNAVQ